MNKFNSRAPHPVYVIYERHRIHPHYEFYFSPGNFSSVPTKLFVSLTDVNGVPNEVNWHIQVQNEDFSI